MKVLTSLIFYIMDDYEYAYNESYHLIYINSEKGGKMYVAGGTGSELFTPNIYNAKKFERRELSVAKMLAFITAKLIYKDSKFSLNVVDAPSSEVING